MNTIGIASDHGGFELKQHIITIMTNIKFIDLGTTSHESVHYPYFADKLCHKILSQELSCGILICGTGMGISMRANRHSGIRAAVVHDIYTAEMAKAHNNANILCLGGRTTTPKTSELLIQKWLDTKFEGGRHNKRISLIDHPTSEH